jgi:hypothetical protein
MGQCTTPGGFRRNVSLVSFHRGYLCATFPAEGIVLDRAFSAVKTHCHRLSCLGTCQAKDPNRIALMRTFLEPSNSCWRTSGAPRRLVVSPRATR